MMALPSFPLLAKELVEQAMRKRTYVARTGYAVLLLSIFPLLCMRAPNSGSSSHHFGLLGLGGEIFNNLLVIQYWAICALMPVLTAGSLTIEKEQGTLTILLLTDMGPWELLLQKLLSRLVISGTFILLGIPLMALAYTYGGVDLALLLLCPLVLLATSLQIGAVALAMSAWCRTTLGALIGTAVALALLYLGPLLLRWRLPLDDRSSWNGDEFWPGRVLPGLGYTGSSYSRPNTLNMTDGWPALLSAWCYANSGVLVSTVAFLILARLALTRRSEISQPSLLLRMFRALDRIFERGDRLLGRRGPSASLPIDDPVAWRALNRSSYASWRYLLRILLPAGGGGLILLSFMVHLNVRYLQGIFAGSCLILLALQLLLLTVLAAGAISSERSRHTLEVLLVSPIDPRTLVLHKMRAVWRISWVMMIPQVIIIVIISWCFGLEVNHRDNYRASNPHVSFTAFTSYAVYLAILPPQFAWMAMIVGLQIRNPTRAMVIALICALAWLATFIGIGFLFSLWNVEMEQGASFLIFLTPASLPLFSMIDADNLSEFPQGPVPEITLFAIWHGGLWWAARRWCLRNAGRLMRRSTAD